MIIDSHCHLNYEPMSLSLKKLSIEQIKMELNIYLQFQQRIKVMIKFLILYQIIIVFMDLMAFILMKLKIIN